MKKTETKAQLAKRLGVDPRRIKYIYVQGKDGSQVKVSNVVKSSDGTEHVMDFGTSQTRINHG